MSRLVPPWVYPEPTPDPPDPVDPRVVQDWAPLSFSLSDGYTEPGPPSFINTSAFTGFSWTEGDPGVWTVAWTQNTSEVDGIREMPQLQFNPSDLFSAGALSSLESGSIIQVSVEFTSATVPTGYGVGPAVAAAYGSAGAASVGSLEGNGFAIALEGGGIGNARGADMRTTFDVVREEFDWPDADYDGASIIFELCLRKDDETQDRTAFIRITCYLADGTAFYYDGTAGSASDVTFADLLILFGFYSRFGTVPAGSYEMVFTAKYRLLEADVFPSAA